jgi:hypothetical protein
MRILFLLSLLSLIACDSNRQKLILNAGDTDRNQSIVHIHLPENTSPQPDPWELVDQKSGAAISIQKINDTEAVFILDQPLSAGMTREYVLLPAGTGGTTLHARESEGELALAAGQKPLLTYNIAVDCPPEGLPEYYCRSGYIHPLHSPSGAVVTDGFPVGHTHQHGLFFAWVNTTFRGDFTDFWNQQKETGTGAHRELTATTSGPVFTGFSSKLQQISLKHGPVLDEEWNINAYDLEKYYVLDVVSTQTNITNDTLYINEYHYGGFGIRGSRLWNEVDSLHFKSDAQFLTSEGKTREEANHSRPRWTAMYGETERGAAGVAILDHPDNFRHPQPVRVHPTMPYFCLAPMVEGAFFIAPDETYVSKYRVVTFDGEPDAKALDELWADYADPVKVSLVQ